MIFKINFITPIDYQLFIEYSDTQSIYSNEMTGLPTVRFNDSEIGLILNDEGNVDGLEISNQCTRTWNIESELLLLASRAAEENGTEVRIFDGNGFTEVHSGQSLFDNYLG